MKKITLLAMAILLALSFSSCIAEDSIKNSFDCSDIDKSGYYQYPPSSGDAIYYKKFNTSYGEMRFELIHDDISTVSDGESCSLKLYIPDLNNFKNFDIYFVSEGKKPIVEFSFDLNDKKYTIGYDYKNDEFSKTLSKRDSGVQGEFYNLSDDKDLMEYIKYATNIYIEEYEFLSRDNIHEYETSYFKVDDYVKNFFYTSSPLPLEFEENAIAFLEESDFFYIEEEGNFLDAKRYIYADSLNNEYSIYLYQDEEDIKDKTLTSLLYVTIPDKGNVSNIELEYYYYGHIDTSILEVNFDYTVNGKVLENLSIKFYYKGTQIDSYEAYSITNVPNTPTVDEYAKMLIPSLNKVVTEYKNIF